MKNNTIKKLTALLLALLLLAGLMPAAGYADELPAAQTEAAAGASQASAAPDADETDEAEDVSAEPDEEPAAETDGGSGQPAAEPQTDERIRVVVVSEIEDLRVTVYPAPTEETPEPEAIEPEEDGSWLLAAGDYVYSAEAEGYLPLEKVAFTLTEEDAPDYALCPELTAVSESVEPAAEETVTIEEPTPSDNNANMETASAEGTLSERAASNMETTDVEPDEFTDEQIVTQTVNDEILLAANNAPEPAVWASGNCGYSATWTLTTDGVLTISGTGEIKNYSDGTGPWTSTGFDFSKVVIEDGITRIGNYAFSRCSSLNYVEIPDSVKSIGKDAFGWCWLQSIELPEGLTEISEYLLLNNSPLKSVIIPSSVTTIGPNAFSGCSGLTSMTLPHSVSKIQYAAFKGCGLTDLTVEGNVTQIYGDSGYSATFGGCSNLTRLTVGNEVDVLTESFLTAFDLANTKTKSVSFVGENCFSYTGSDCTVGGLTMTAGNYYVDPNGVLYLLNDDMTATLFHCPADTTTFTLPDTITTPDGDVYRVSGISDSAFSDCPNLESVELAEDNDAYILVDDVLFTRDMTTLISYPAAKKDSFYSVPDGVTTISKSAFANCTNLNSVHLPQSTVSIGDRAFYGCTNLSSFTIPDNVTEIGNEAFRGCTDLSQIEIPDSVKDLGEYVFYGCTSLADAKIGNGVTDIGPYAFCNCQSLTNIVLGESVKSIGTMAFYGLPFTEITIPNGVNEIADYAFSDGKLTGVKIPGSVKRIGKHAFSESQLSYVEFGDGVTSIDSYAFYHCDKLLSVVIPDSVTNLSADAFTMCMGLREASVGDGVTEWVVFNTCRDLITLSLGSGVTTVKVTGCDSLTSIEVSEDNQTLSSEDGILFNRDKTKLLIYPSGKSAASYAVPDSVTDIEEFAFYSCNALDSVTIPNSVSHISSKAFYSCTGLTSVVLDSDLSNTYFGTPFSESPHLTKVTIGPNVDLIQTAFLDSAGKNSGGIKELEFIGPNYFSVTGDNYSVGNMTLEAGNYYADENGLLYRLNDDSTATLVRYPETLTAASFELPETIEAEDGTGNYQVTSISNYAFLNNAHLEEVTIPTNVTSIGVGSFYDCSKLKEVNGKTKLNEVLQELDGTGANVITFMNTALWRDADGFVTETNETIKITDSGGRTFQLSTDKTEVYTGESVESVLSISGGHESESVARVFFRFENEYGSINEEIGEYNSQGVTYRVCQSDIPNIYYLEVDPVDGDKTFSLRIASTFENIVCGGGDALIWLSLLTREEASDLGNGVTEIEKAHLVHWKTKADDFPVTKKVGYSASLSGDGTGTNDDIWVKSLNYSITMERSGETLAYGKDYMTSVDFVDTLTLPEGFRWRDGLKEAIANHQWGTKVNSYNVDYYVVIDRMKYTLCTLERRYSDNAVSFAKVALDDVGNVQIFWTYNNVSTGEIPKHTATVTYGDSVIAADGNQLAERIADTGNNICQFDNSVVAVQHFRYSEDKQERATATYKIAAGQASLRLKKSGVANSTLGAPANFTITAENIGVLPLTTLAHVIDSLQPYFYLSGADMETMFRSDSYGHDLRIIIEHADLCETKQHVVIGVDGQQHIVNQQFEGHEVPHEERSEKDTDNTRETDVTLMLSWSEDGTYLILTHGTEQYSIGEGKQFPDIQHALDFVGLVIVEETSYTCDWNQAGKNLHSGELRQYLIRSSVKDSFMRMNGDRLWWIIDGTIYQQSVGNTAVAQDNNNNIITTAGHTVSTINRDFTLDKEAYLDGKLVDNTVVVNFGDVLTYTTVVTHDGEGSYDALPFVDRMEGAQVLMVPVSTNTSLKNRGLGTVVHHQKTYYVLGPGVYENIIIGGFRADRVEVTQKADGLDTLIYWYLTNIRGNQTFTVSYFAKVSADYGRPDTNVYTLSNKVWLNDHQTHRLYDEAFVGGAILKMNKYIVPNVDGDALNESHNPADDQLEKLSTIEEGMTVTYRLLLEGDGEHAVHVTGSSISDELPVSIGQYWHKENGNVRGNVRVVYVPDRPEGVTVKNGELWRIDPAGENRQVLRWDDDFQVTLENARLFIYVILTFPSGNDWAEYCHHYGITYLNNVYHVDELDDEVFHNLAVKAEVLLQKGVYQTGVASRRDIDRYLPKTDEDSLSFYTNDGQDYGFITYYCALYNSGDSRMYLSDIQDVLPEGFTYYGLFVYDTSTRTYYVTGNENYAGSLISVGDSSTVYKTATVSASVISNKDGHQVVKFSLSNESQNGNLNYDEERGRYYLYPGEAVVFAYNCRTNSFRDTMDSADNIIAMPYYNYNGAGARIDYETVADRTNKRGMISNNGSRAIMVNSQAKLLGMNIGETDNSTQWLTSEVTVSRGSIIPGITKSPRNPFVSGAETITWDVVASNTGTENMRGYTLTDEMMSPYQFTGAVGYRLDYNQSQVTSYAAFAYTENLFTIDERAEDDQTVTITGKYGSATLSVNGPAQPLKTGIKVVGRQVNDSYEWKVDVPLYLYVSLSRNEETGAETLSIQFPEEGTIYPSIPAGGFATLTLLTKNYTGSRDNASYINTCYITPSVSQPFDTGAISQGNYTEYNGKDSVVNEAVVTATNGYATSAVKSVKEIQDPENHASSIDTTNYIVLPDPMNTFRYSLSVDNTISTGENHAMDLLVLIDNLPEKDDHATFYDSIKRYSAFKVDFVSTEELDFRVEVHDGESLRELDENQYLLEFSEGTNFLPGEWEGKHLDNNRWYTLADINGNPDLKLSDMRSFRIVIKDQSGTLIPSGATVTVSFNAVINSEQTLLSGQIAWNSFGYHYSLLGDEAELEAAPRKVGVRTPIVPNMVKNLVDMNGDAYAAKKDESFEFVIYEGSALSLTENYTKADVLNALNDRIFTIVTLDVNQGESASESKSLDSFFRCDSEGNPTETAWTWKSGKQYTLLELPSNDGDYIFGSINGNRPNNHTFIYRAAAALTLSCTNIRDSWNVQLIKRDQHTNYSLSGAAFGLYSKNEADQFSAEAYRALTAEWETKPGTTTEAEGTTWYLQDIQTSGDDGTILWTGLEGDAYYVLELQAPEHYKLSEDPGRLVSKADCSDRVAAITVANPPTKELIIRKVVEGEGAPKVEFNFVLNMKDEDGNPVTGSFCGKTFDNEGNLAFKLTAGDEIRLAEIPDGYQYKVSEIDLPTNFRVRQAEYEGVMEVEVAAIEVEFTNLYGKVTYELPSGGGSGTYLFTIGGSAVLTFALFLTLQGGRKRRRRAAAR